MAPSCKLELAIFSGENPRWSPSVAKLVDIFIKSRLHEDNGDRVEESLGAEVAEGVVKAE